MPSGRGTVFGLVLLASIVGSAGCAKEGAEDPTVYAVPVEGDPSRGPDDAPVTIVIASEFACPYCVEASGAVEKLERAYPGRIRVIWKHFIVHRELATVPALAACAAGRQGSFWEMERLIFETAWTAPPEPKLRDRAALGQDAMLSIAESLGLDADRFVQDMLGESCRAEVDEDRRILLGLGNRGTPAFYVNGRHVPGVRSHEAFKRLVDEELARAEAAVRAGTPPERIYQTLVMERGRAPGQAL
jgi:protein-disulfide isomerase